MNQDDFERFLAWLNPDRDEAGKLCEEIRRRLIKICESRGHAEAAEIADEVIDRVMRKAREIADSYVGDPLLYFCGVLRNVLHEWKRPKPLTSLLVPLPDHWDEKEPLHACLDECLNKLSSDDRQLALLYHTDDGRAKIVRRQELAEKLGITVNALRIRMCRIRATLHACISECLQESAP